MGYFDNVVIAVATLMEPLMASLIAFACHAGLLVSGIMCLLLFTFCKKSVLNFEFNIELAWTIGVAWKLAIVDWYIGCSLPIDRERRRWKHFTLIFILFSSVQSETLPNYHIP